MRTRLGDLLQRMTFGVRCQSRACKHEEAVMGLGVWLCGECGSEHALTPGVATLRVFHPLQRGVSRRVQVPFVVPRRTGEPTRPVSKAIDLKTKLSDLLRR